ncbi:hypothetical protein FHT93_001256 [Rhizobium sp. BK379]|nr:hypothetical protein [Rhizobium sp. BK379]
MTPAAKYQVKHLSIYIGLIVSVAVVITVGAFIAAG